MKKTIVFACLLASAANAAIITYTDRTAFLAAITGTSYEESFGSLASGALGAWTQAFSGNGLSYQVAVLVPDELYGSTISGNRSVGTNSGSELFVHSLTGGINAIGGYFRFESVDDISTTSAGIVAATNSTDPGDTVVNIGPGTSATTFVGFISTSPINLLRIEETSFFGTPNIDDLIVAAAADESVPEPSSIGLALAGLAALAARRVRQ